MEKTPSSTNVALAKEKRMGPFLLKKVLGKGSTGHVRLGVHKDTGLEVAVKIISKKRLSIEKDLQHKVEREIAILKLIKHPHVLSLYDVYESDHNLYLVLEYVEGGELFDYLAKKGKLTLDETLVFFQQIISAIDYCHHHFICHRDLKPENLLLDRHNNLKIADFGMASLQQLGSLLDQSCGTPHYASPEVIRGIKYDGRLADVWSCGVILHALLTGSLPFDDDNITKLLTKIKVGLFKMPEDLPADVQTLLRRILTVNPSKRYTMDDIKTNPWFQSNSRFSALPVPPVYTHLPPLPEGQSLDDDVLFSMRNLGCFSEQAELMAALQSPESNLEKIVYYLLLERKIMQPATADDEHSSATTEVTNDLVATGSAETIKKRTDNVVSLEESLAQISFLRRRESLEGMGLLPRPFAQSPADGQHHAGSLTRSPSFSLVEMRRKENRVQYLPTTPEEGHPNQLLEKVRKSKSSMFYPIGSDDESDMEVDHLRPASPDASILSSSPNRSWFGDLFNKSRETFSVDIDKPLEKTLEFVLSVCAGHGIDCVRQADDAIKCTHYPTGGSRPLVFQITVQQRRDPGPCTVSLRLLYGFQEVFRSVADQLHRELKRKLDRNIKHPLTTTSLDGL
eukprot:comp18910_c0_seq1/m.21055 comp18910_c0_seq1/g.21055  ORF comp18910_c0_seq1/g.21055 comp18910_c0_seq1/m.21055 type:complete len:624 (-) comp18910_c0_seq1:444-2315(-)